MGTRLAVLVFLAGCGAGAPGPDFSGAWTLSVGKSDFGRGTPPRALVMTVRQTEGELRVESTLTDARGESSSAYTLDLTGKEAENTIRGNRAVSVTNWRGPVLHVKARTQVQGVEIRTVDQWQLSGDGRELTVYRTAATPNGEIEQRYVYEKHLERR
jgi:hypothetical protein